MWGDHALANPAQPYQFPGYAVARFKGVRSGGFQCTEWADGTIELYDLVADAAQMRTVANDPRHAENQAILAEALTKLDECAGPACDVDLAGLTHP